MHNRTGVNHPGKPKPAECQSKDLYIQSTTNQSKQILMNTHSTTKTGGSNVASPTAASRIQLTPHAPTNPSMPTHDATQTSNRPTAATAATTDIATSQDTAGTCDNTDSRPLDYPDLPQTAPAPLSASRSLPLDHDLPAAEEPVAASHDMAPNELGSNQAGPFMSARKFHAFLYSANDYVKWVASMARLHPADLRTSHTDNEASISLVLARSLSAKADNFISMTATSQIDIALNSRDKPPGDVADALFESNLPMVEQYKPGRDLRRLKGNSFRRHYRVHSMSDST